MHISGKGGRASEALQETFLTFSGCLNESCVFPLVKSLLLATAGNLRPPPRRPKRKSLPRGTQDRSGQGRHAVRPRRRRARPAGLRVLPRRGGNSTIVANPKLAGQHEGYIYKQLVDFTTAEPPAAGDDHLRQDADRRREAEHRRLAGDPAAQKPGAAKNKDTVELGRKIYRGGIAEKRRAACASCHGATGAGIPAQYPRLAGQHQDYTLTQLGLQERAAQNSPQMSTLAKRMSDEEMKAVADYIAGLK
jgi:cytochrome c553